MKNKNINAREANKILYNLCAEEYKEIDKRRKQRAEWLVKKLQYIKSLLYDNTGNTVHLDLGCGSGFLIIKAKPYFEKQIGVDIAENILKLLPENTERICADIEKTSLESKSVDFISLFSVLHHLESFSGVIKEAYRVLKDNGILYIDHDIEKNFVKNFRFFLKIYRKFFSYKKGFLKKEKKEISEIYDIAEVHSNGVDSNEIISIAQNNGFSIIEIKYHWMGLNKFLTFFCEKIIPDYSFPKGFAPVCSYIFRKK